MRKKVISIIIICLYCFPFVYYSMYQDITNRSLYGYLILIVGTSVLSFLSDFFGNFKLIIIGNLVSIIISFCFIHWMGFDGRPYGWADDYFKPFGVNLSLFVFSLLNLIPQLLAMFIAKWIKPNRKKTLNWIKAYP